MYGPLPLQLTETTTPSTEFTRVPVDTVYEQILSDLRYAEANLGYVTKDYGRVTKGAVQHLMAKVYLTRLRDTNAVADEAAKQQAGNFANADAYALRINHSAQAPVLSAVADAVTS